MRFNKSSLLSSLFAAASVTVLAAGIVGAQNSDTTNAQTGVSLVTRQSTEDQAAHLQRLADNLGITLEELNAAILTTNTALIDQAVTDGTLTQEQADDLKTRMAAGETLFGGRFLHGPADHGGRGFPFEAVAGEVATFLGVTEDELRAQLADGSSLAAIAATQGKSVDDLKATITAAAKAELDGRVADGTLEQADADEKLATLAEGLDDLVNDDSGRALFHGPRGDRHGPMDGGLDDATQEESTATATATTAT